MGFPSDKDPVLSIERRAAGEARAGEEFAYTLEVKNESKFMLHDIVIHEAIAQVPGGEEQAGVQQEQQQQPQDQRQQQQQAQQSSGAQLPEQTRRQLEQAQQMVERANREGQRGGGGVQQQNEQRQQQQPQRQEQQQEQQQQQTGQVHQGQQLPEQTRQQIEQAQQLVERANRQAQVQGPQNVGEQQQQQQDRQRQQQQMQQDQQQPGEQQQMQQDQQQPGEQQDQQQQDQQRQQQMQQQQQQQDQQRQQQMQQDQQRQQQIQQDQQRQQQIQQDRQRQQDQQRQQQIQQDQQGRQRTQRQPQQRPQGQEQDWRQQQAGDEQTGRTWNIPALRPGESRTFQGSIALPEREGAINVCTTATYQQAHCSAIEVTAPALRLQAMIIDAKGNQVRRVIACDEVYLRLRVGNPGSAATEPVRVTMDLPQGVQAEGARGQQLQLQLDAVPPGKTVEHKVRLRFAGDANVAGNVVAQAGELGARAPLASVQVVKPVLELAAEGPQRTYLGRPITWTITVNNRSEAPANDAKVKLNVPDGMERVSVNGRGVSERDGQFHLGNMAPGESRTFQLTFELNRAGLINGHVSAEAYCAEAVQQPIQTEVVGIPAIRLEAIDLTDPVGTNDTAVYEVQVKNQGTAEDLDLQLQAQLPPQLKFIDGSGDTEVTGEGQIIRFAPVERLAPGDVLTWRIRARVLQPGQARLVVQMVSKANQQPIIEQEPTTLIEGQTPAGADQGQRQGQGGRGDQVPSEGEPPRRR